MADIVLFGATGYTGRLTAAALAARGASFALAGRDGTKLASLAEQVGAEGIHIAEVGDVPALVRALGNAKVLISTVGPFEKLGETAVRAAVDAGVHYVDSTGEGPFIDRLGSEFDDAARRAQCILAPSMGFDEVPGDMIATIATEGMERPDLTITYAVPTTGSAGTVRSALGVIGSKGPIIEEGRVRWAGAGRESRWAPFPPPLGPSETWLFPLALGRLAPAHLQLNSFKTYVRTSRMQGKLMGLGAPVIGALNASPVGRLFDLLQDVLPEGPSEQKRVSARWTLLAEASSKDRRRNVVATGSDVYGLTAETLSTAAMTMTEKGYSGAGLTAPVPAVGLEVWEKVMAENGVTIEVYAED